ncbi:hypothetical protein F4808DRAFT_71757 [Astrocystis sublimbata]|nr:hypothetical protein F4808DRAFT_71757 [Astrocystis sublimbata]
MASQQSPLMRIPAELRLMIYSYLFDAGTTEAHSHEGYYPDSDDGSDYEEEEVQPVKKQPKIISIRNGREPVTPRPGALETGLCSQCGQCLPATPERKELPVDDGRPQRRSRYHVQGGSLARRYYETTYHLANEGAYFCTSLMAVNRQIYHETSHLVYNDHIFDFGANIEAVKPFFSDLTDDARALVKQISLYKRGPGVCRGWSDRSEWQAMCTYLCDCASVEHLRLVVQAGRLPEARKQEWGRQWGSVEIAPRQLSCQDVALLVGIRNPMLDWVEDLFPMKTLRDVEVLPDFCVMPVPQNSDMVVYMALSASVDKGFSEYMRERFGSSCCSPAVEV